MLPRPVVAAEPGSLSCRRPCTSAAPTPNSSSRSTPKSGNRKLRFSRTMALRLPHVRRTSTLATRPNKPVNPQGSRVPRIYQVRTTGIAGESVAVGRPAERRPRGRGVAPGRTRCDRVHTDSRELVQKPLFGAKPAPQRPYERARTEPVTTRPSRPVRRVPINSQPRRRHAGVARLLAQTVDARRDPLACLQHSTRSPDPTAGAQPGRTRSTDVV